ncbi:hypothetical protein FisN_14Hu037 [Fistulifera solaris]|jgi:hypothetical protein|uniref:BTB domain-containing protein n=1 Tax=Fistulifera solaris TaxID=1519565 RepID=A0A1Z5K831_FISSO|nr:hypothetical protein FisN_14Hu037 [Fistulifera solaris]|eukprot:GAX22423.1 hypothetical protein FisN_14Hu037 [Fistulifera solaris]
MDNKIVRLNVGGTRYDVSRDTLARCEGSMLASLISKQWKEGNLNEPIFIDRNGRLFEYILDYLRTNEVHLPLSVNRTAVEKEFDYYAIPVDWTQVHLPSLDEWMEEVELRQMQQFVTFVREELSKLPYWEKKVKIPPSVYVQLCGHDQLLSQLLSDRGMQLISREWEDGSPCIQVKKTEDWNVKKGR